MDIAERYGLDLRRWLRSAERFSDLAIAVGLWVKTLSCRVIASLLSVTRADHLRPVLRCVVFRAGLRRVFDAVLRLACWGMILLRRIGVVTMPARAIRCAEQRLP